jgi:hypothetical protein
MRRSLFEEKRRRAIMYRFASTNPQDGTPVRQSCQPPLISHPPPRKMANPYLQSRGISHFRDMPNPYALPGDAAYHPLPLCSSSPASFAAAAKRPPSAPAWSLKPRDKPERGFMSALQGLEGSMPGLAPRNLAEEQDFEMTSEEPELPVLNFGDLQNDANDSLSSLGNLYTMTSAPLLEMHSMQQRKKSKRWECLRSMKKKS